MTVIVVSGVGFFSLVGEILMHSATTLSLDEHQQEKSQNKLKCSVEKFAEKNWNKYDIQINSCDEFPQLHTAIVSEGWKTIKKLYSRGQV